MKIISAQANIRHNELFGQVYTKPETAISVTEANHKSSELLPTVAPNPKCHLQGSRAIRDRDAEEPNYGGNY